MLVREDLRSTKNELLDEYSSHVIHRSYVKRDCQRRTLSGNFTMLPFRESLSEMLLISACVFGKQFSKKSDALDPKLLHMMTFKTNIKTSYLVATDAEQVVDKYILLDVLVCSIAEYFGELCRILTSPYGESKYKQRRFRNALQQNSPSRLLYLLKTYLT